jgi:iron complex outermembrane receptor protein
MYRLTGSASGPVTDTLAYRLSGSMHERDGYYDNSVGDDLNHADDWNLQGKLQWEPTNSLSILLSASHVDRDTTCCSADAIQSESVNEELTAQRFSPDKNDPYDYDYSIDQDADRSQLDVLTVIDDNYSGDSLSQELRFTSTAGDNFDYSGDDKPFVFLGDDFLTIGSQQDLDLFTPLSFLATPGDNLVIKFKQETETIAVFTQATWHIGETWHVTGGLRWSDEEKETDLFSQTNSTAPSVIFGGSFLDSVSTPIDNTLDRSTDNVDWLIRAAMDIGDNSMMFASAATGTKSGGFNTVNGTAEEREFDDEETLSYELGVKSTLLGQRLRINATAFYSEIDDFQSQQQQETGIGTFVSNAAEVETSGLDFQVEALPLPNLTLSAGLLYMHKYEVTDGPDEGLELPFTEDYSGNLAATLVFPLGDGSIYWRTDYSYMDDHSTNVAS